MSATKAAAKIRVSLVDDHPMVRAGIRGMLADCPGIKIVSEASGGVEALSKILEAPPDLVLLDVILPEVDGLHVLRELRRRLPKTKVLIVSALESDYSMRAAIEDEADGYLTKQASRDEMIGAIQAVMAGETFMTDLCSPRGKRPAPPLLTDRQLQVLKLMSEGRSNKEIAFELDVTAETVKSHVTEILRRLEVRDRTSAVAKALQEKLI